MTSIRRRYQCHQCRNRVSCSFSLGDRTCCIGWWNHQQNHSESRRKPSQKVMFLISKGCSPTNFVFAWEIGRSHFQGGHQLGAMPWDPSVRRNFCSPETTFRASPSGQISQSQGLVPNLFHHTHFLGSEKKKPAGRWKNGGKMENNLMWEMRNGYAAWMCI